MTLQDMQFHLKEWVVLRAGRKLEVKVTEDKLYDEAVRVFINGGEQVGTIENKLSQQRGS